MGFLNKLFGREEKRQEHQQEQPDASKTASVVIVSGLPRSGTSMMMKMLEAGGLNVFTDNHRVADADNPQGYYEYERVKQLDKGDTAWVADAQGQVVKVISALLEYLPSEHDYNVLFMHRNIKEVLASQQKMLTRREEEGGAISDEEMAALYEKHLTAVNQWLDSQSNFSVLHVDYNELLADPVSQTQEVYRFLGKKLDIERMVQVVNPQLYRNRAQSSPIT